MVDEAFSSDPDVERRADIYRLYQLIYNKFGSHAVRAVLIGQEIHAIKEAHPKLDWVFEKSTLIIGSQSESKELREVLLPLQYNRSEECGMARLCVPTGSYYCRK